MRAARALSRHKTRARCRVQKLPRIIVLQNPSFDVPALAERPRRGAVQRFAVQEYSLPPVHWNAPQGRKQPVDGGTPGAMHRHPLMRLRREISNPMRRSPLTWHQDGTRGLRACRVIFLSPRVGSDQSAPAGRRFKVVYFPEHGKLHPKKYTCSCGSESRKSPTSGGILQPCTLPENNWVRNETVRSALMEPVRLDLPQPFTPPMMV